MAHLWVKGTSNEWTVKPMDADDDVLYANLRDRSYRHDERDPGEETVALMRVTGTNTEVWILMAGRDADVRVNGSFVAGGLRALCDRDEIVVRGERRYFSTEKLARIEPRPHLVSPPTCPRCQQTIDEGSDAVRCPQCQIWHHQSGSLTCWTYADTCTMCPQPTDLQAGYRWTPDADA